MIFVVNIRPTPTGWQFAWWMLSGITASPVATAARTASASSPSSAATIFIASVTMPFRAASNCVICLLLVASLNGG